MMRRKSFWIVLAIALLPAAYVAVVVADMTATAATARSCVGSYSRDPSLPLEERVRTYLETLDSCGIDRGRVSTMGGSIDTAFRPGWKELAVFAVSLIPACIWLLVWRFRRFFASGWVRLGAVLWIGWAGWRIYELDTGWGHWLAEFAVQVVLLPAAVALAVGWVARGFRGSNQRQYDPADSSVQRSRLLLIAAIAGPAMLGCWTEHRIGELEWTVEQLAERLADVQARVEDMERELDTRVDNLTLEVDILSTMLDRLAEY